MIESVSNGVDINVTDDYAICIFFSKKIQMLRFKFFHFATVTTIGKQFPTVIIVGKQFATVITVAKQFATVLY